MRTIISSAVLLLTVACTSDLPQRAAPLGYLEAPLALEREPDDEALRAGLEPGSFSGVIVVDAAATLDALADGALGLEIVEVVENSPAIRAGLQRGDLLLEAQSGSEAPIELAWASQWRELELESAPGSELLLIFDRAGMERECTLQLAPRLAPAARDDAERFTEQERTGVVLRTATEVEARAAGLAPGAGAVIVGLDRDSPWRRAGLGFGDLIVELDGAPLADPLMLLDTIRKTPKSGSLHLGVLRSEFEGGSLEALDFDAAVTKRERRMREFNIPLLVDWRRESSQRLRWSVLWGLLGYESTEVAWRMRLLWLIRFGGGDTERLELVR